MLLSFAQQGQKGTEAKNINGTVNFVHDKLGRITSTTDVWGQVIDYTYDPNGNLNVYRPTSGAIVARLPAGHGHWNSPIVTDGRVALPEGDANDHSMSGVLNIYHLR